MVRIDKKALKALETIVKALGPLSPEARRQVVEAAHSLVEIGKGRQNADQGAGPDQRKR